MFTYENLRELVSYNPETGVTVWLPRDRKWFSSAAFQDRWNSMYAGKETFIEAGKKNYYRAVIMQKKCSAHRAIWLYMTGDWPKNVIDHIDGNGRNNKWANLRDVETVENTRNRRIHKTNRSGCHGVYWREEKQAWAAQIGERGKTVFLGNFNTKEEAVAARAGAEIVLGYHENHGRPA